MGASLNSPKGKRVPMQREQHQEPLKEARTPTHFEAGFDPADLFLLKHLSASKLLVSEGTNKSRFRWPPTKHQAKNSHAAKQSPGIHPKGASWQSTGV